MSQILRLVGHAYGHYPLYVLSAHAHNLAQCVGKHRQQAASINIMELSDIDAVAHGVCALKSSSCTTQLEY